MKAWANCGVSGASSPNRTLLKTPIPTPRRTSAREKAGVDFQLRAKAATDTTDLGHAQKLLGHKTRGMTEHYTRDRIGDTVAPLNSGIVDKRAVIVEKRISVKSPKPA